MAKKISIPAIRISQPTGTNRAIYMGALKVRELIDESQFTVDHWTPEKKDSEKQGYQRKPGNTRISKIARFTMERKDAILPAAILVSARPRSGEDALKFKEHADGSGTLEISHYHLYIVDGQHRIAGLRYAAQEFEDVSWLDYHLPVVFLSNFDRVEEIRQFYFLNTYQKKVSTDLAERLIADLARRSPEERDRQITEKTDWGNRALKVIDLLNESPDSPWYKKIRLPNAEKLPTNIVNQVSFKKSLQPIFKDGLLSAVKDADKGYEILKNYWNAVKNVFPEAFASPNDYVIQKTPGVFSLHQLAHKVLLHLGRNETTELAFRKVLKNIFDEDSDYSSDWWRGDNTEGAGLYGSMKGFAIMAREFEDKLENVIK